MHFHPSVKFLQHAHWTRKFLFSTMDCSLQYTILNSTFLTVSVSFIITCIVIISSVVKNYTFAKSNPPKPKPPLIHLLMGCVFCCVTVIGLSVHAYLSVFWCKYGDNVILLNIYIACHASQLALLLYFWFIRISNSFNNTKWALSNRVQRFYVVSYVLLLIYMATAVIFATNAHDYIIFRTIYLWSIFAALAVIFYLILTISLLVIFIKNLITVYRTTDSDPLFVSLITKMAILNFLSSFITILMAISNITMNEANIGTEYFANFTNSTDLFTNFLFALLSFGDYDKYYMILCGVMHRRCNTFWLIMVGTTPDERNLKMSMDIERNMEKNIEIQSRSTQQHGEQI